MSENSSFECWWEVEGARFSTGDHKERARHAWEAALKTTNRTPVAQGFWLDALEYDKEDIEESNRIGNAICKQHAPK